MKKSFLLLFLVSAISVFAQVENPVSWSFEKKKTGDAEYKLIFKASIEDGWHLYGMNIASGGPIPTTFSFDEQSAVEFISGFTQKGKSKKVFDTIFNIEIELLEKDVVFSRMIKLKTDKPVTITGAVAYMSCDDKRCLPPESTEFSFSFEESDLTSAKSASVKEVQSDSVVVSPPDSDLLDTTAVVDIAPPADESEQKSLFVFFLVAVSLGFLGLLTPCVYPMIPITINFFLNRKGSKSAMRLEALFFGISIIFIYTFFGLLISLLFGADAIKNVSSHWITNLIFFLLFMFFAASFFGAFEILLPASLSNRADRNAERGGLVGSFFMALTLVLVSFSCTAPFIGGLLVEAAQGSVVKPALGMFGFSLASGIAFSLLAFFPSLVKKMPRSGGWLNTVKVTIAFIITAVGLKYLLVPNEVLGIGISREFYIATWIVLSILLGLYLLGKIRFAHDSKVESISLLRLVLSILSFIFAIYLVSGLFGKPLPMLASFMPSKSLMADYPEAGKGTEVANVLCDTPMYSEKLYLPDGLQGYFDLEQGLACAREKGLPVLVAFKGHACANCKVMEAKILSDTGIQKLIMKNFIFISLYTDDPTDLSEQKWVVSKYDGKTKKTMGQVNRDFEITNYNTNTIPLYAILDNDGNKISESLAYTTDKEEFEKFLRKNMK